MPVDWQCSAELLDLIKTDPNVAAFDICPVLESLPIRPTDHNETRIARIRRHNEIETAVVLAIEAHNELVKAAEDKRAHEEEERKRLELEEEEEEEDGELSWCLSYNRVRLSLYRTLLLTDVFLPAPAQVPPLYTDESGLLQHGGGVAMLPVPTSNE